MAWAGITGSKWENSVKKLTHKKPVPYFTNILVFAGRQWIGREKKVTSLALGKKTYK